MIRIKILITLFVLLSQSLLALNVSAATAPIAEVEGRVLSFDEKSVTIEQIGDRIKITKDSIQNWQDVKVGKTVVLKVRNDGWNSVEVPKDFKLQQDPAQATKPQK